MTNVDSKLLSCVKSFNLKAVKICLANDADVNVTDENDETPAQLAVKYRQLEILKTILKHGGVDYNHKNRYGKNIFQISNDCFSDSMEAHFLSPIKGVFVERKIDEALHRYRKKQLIDNSKELKQIYN